jgi:hypothetical protein
VTETIQRAPSYGRFVALSGLTWLALPFVGLRYWQVWDRLPLRMATHFDATGRPNGWMWPRASLELTLVLMLFLVALFSAILFYAFRRARGLDASVWAVLGLLYVIIFFFVFISESVLRYNLYGTSPRTEPIVLGVLVAILVFTVIYLRVQRGAALPPADVFAEEAHSSRLFALVFLVPALIETGAAIAVPIGGIRIALGLGAALLLVGAVFAWDGFHYRFSPAGVDIRTLGFRLRSIHAADIQGYEVAPWSVLRGYGIRGLGRGGGRMYGETVGCASGPAKAKFSWDTATRRRLFEIWIL